MMSFAFQETTYLAIRRSMFLVSFVLAIIVCYEISIPIPLTEIQDPILQKTKQQVIEYVHASIALVIYLGYLLFRSFTHGKAHKMSLGIERKIRFSREFDAIEEGKKLIDRIEGIDGNPVRGLLPTDDQIERYSNNNPLNIKGNTLETACYNTTEQIETLTKLHTSLEQQIERLEQVAKVPEEKIQLDQRQRQQLFETKDHIVTLIGKLNDCKIQITQDIDNQVDVAKSLQEIKNEIFTTAKHAENDIKRLLVGLKKYVGELESDNSKVLEALDNDVETWDIKVPRTLASFMIVTTVIVLVYRSFPA